MANEKKSSKEIDLADKLKKMPKDTAGQRVKYLLAKHKMKQSELRLQYYGGDKDKSDRQSSISNFNSKLNDKRTITPKDAETIAKVFNVFPEFITNGGCENNAELIKKIISEVEAETDLLHIAFRSLSTLSGYNVRRLGYGGEPVEEIVSSLYDYVEIEHNGIVKTLSIKQLNQLENIIYEHAEIAIRRYIEANGEEVK